MKIDRLALRVRAVVEASRKQAELRRPDKVVGSGTPLAVVVREGSEAEAECDTVLK